MTRIVGVVPTHAMTIAICCGFRGVTSFITNGISAVFVASIRDVDRSENEKENRVKHGYDGWVILPRNIFEVEVSVWRSH